jgi:hypothetical protein
LIGMASPKHDLTPIELPRALIFTTALTCGVLAALALQIYLSRTGNDLVSFWQNPRSARALFPWWTSASLAAVVGFVTAAALSHLPLPWRRFRFVRWVVGAVLVFGLAEIGHSAGAASGTSAGANLAASLGALVFSTLMAMFGAYFTVRR